MYSSRELLTLTGKSLRGTVIHPIVEIRLLGEQGGGIIQIVPVALVIENLGEVLTFLIDEIKLSDEQSVG